jgi:hypothetical protein
MKSIAKQLTVILLSVAALSITIAVIIVAIFFDPPCTWYPCEANFAYAFAVGLPLIQTVLALSSYLNLIKTVRNNPFYSALSFFLLPALFLLQFLFGVGFDYDDTLFLLIIDAPFFLLLGLGFLWFRKNKK